MSRKPTLLSRLYWYFGEAWYLLGLPRARWFSKDVKDGFGHAWYKDKIEGVSLLNRIRLWANANWKTRYNVVTTCMMMVIATFVYSGGFYKKAAYLYAWAIVPVLSSAYIHCYCPTNRCRDSRNSCRNDVEATNQDG